MSKYENRFEKLAQEGESGALNFQIARNQRAATMRSIILALGVGLATFGFTGIASAAHGGGHGGGGHVGGGHVSGGHVGGYGGGYRSYGGGYGGGYYGGYGLGGYGLGGYPLTSGYGGYGLNYGYSPYLYGYSGYPVYRQGIIGRRFR